MKPLCVVAFVLSIAALGCEEKIKPTVAEVPVADIPSQESWNSVITISDSAKVRVVLWAGYIAKYADKYYTLLDDSLHVDFYDDHEQHSSLLTARRGSVDDRTHDFAAYKNVVVISDSGTVLKTDSLFWDNATRKIHTKAFVDITSASEHIMGLGMESDQSLKNYKIFRVTGRAITNE
ncbi:MAG: LPS export ABC transporter periplasmic protein LptC [Ignavibacteriae bacterium]|nr:LPS export ABC transporter periplasmic protein LptC [Ignavibacteriota bacterium]